MALFLFKKKSDIRRGSLSCCAQKSNRMPSRPVFLLAFFLSTLGHILAQDPLFSQFYASPLQLNPAMAGVAQAPRISLNYRNQWPSWPNAYSTYALGFEQALNGLNSGFGVSVLADDAGNGIYRTLTLHAVYSYSVQLGDDLYAKFGMEGGVLQTRVDWDRLVFGDQLNPYTGATLPGGGVAPSEENRPSGLQRLAPDLGTGLVLHNSRGYVGVALRHLNRPDENFLESRDNLRVGRPMRLSVHAGWDIGFAKGDHLRYPAVISPNIQIVRQAGFMQINAGAYLGYNLLFGGLWYRHSGGNPDAAIALIGVRQGVLRFGYSYDATLSALGLARTGGAHEVSLGINFAEGQLARRRKKSAQLNNCFNMFR